MIRSSARLAHYSLVASALAFAAPAPAPAQATHTPGAALDERAAVDLALAREGYAELAEAERSGAAAAIAGIRPLDNPSVELSRESAGGESEWQLRAIQPIDLSGRRGALRSAAREEAAAVEHDIARRRDELIADVRGALARCAAAGAQAQVHESFVGRLREAERVAGARAAAGDTAVYDLRRIRVEARSAEADLARSRGERTAECALLGSLAGVSEPKVEIASLTLLQAGGSPSAGRADLAARERRLLAATQRVRAARAARLPEVAVGAGLKQVSDSTGTAYGPVVSLGVTVPIFNAGGAAIAAARARERALSAELVVARRSAQAQQASAAGRAQAARDAAVTAAAARDDAARLGTIAETAYRAGEIGVVELLDAHEAGRDAELKVIELALAAAEAAIAFDLAQGGEVP